MASVLGATNNCPTSDRDGTCIDSRVNKLAVAEIERRNGQVFMPSPADIAARDARDLRSDDALFIADATFDQRLALALTKDEELQAELRAEIKDRETSLDTMPEPTAAELQAVEAEN